MKGEKMFCPNCNEQNEGEVRKIQETYPVKGEEITITANVRFCRCCGQEVWDEELDSQNLLTAFDVYRENHGLLSPQRIREIRTHYGLSQAAFARVLGLGDKTITRYENGSLPDAAQNNLMELMENPQNFSRLLDKNKEKLSVADFKAATDSLNQCWGEDLHVVEGQSTLDYSTQPVYRFAMENSQWEGSRHA